MKTKKTTALVKFKRIRDIDDNDKFFIVKLISDNGIECKAGWIEKDFIENDFMKFFREKGLKFDIVDIIEFADYHKYKEYKTTSEYLN